MAIGPALHLKRTLETAMFVTTIFTGLGTFSTDNVVAIAEAVSVTTLAF